MKDVPGFEDVEKAVIELRGKKIILDSEVAKLYGVTTREINQAVKNNPEKFPTGYILKLDKNEKITPKGYSRTLGYMISGFLIMFSIAFLSYLLF